jgi:hypothetical protein
LEGGFSVASGIDQLYASNIRAHIGLFATWLPNAEVKIGQYGTLDGALFQPMNQLMGLYAKPAPAKAKYDFTIAADRTINTESKALADAGVTHGNVLLEVQFHREAAVSFSAPEAVITRVGDIRELGEKLVMMLNAGDWDRKHAIVVEVVSTPKATIIASEKAGAQVKFEVGAKTPISPQAMADLNEETSLRTYKGVGVKVIGEGPLTPLFRLAFLEKRLFRNPTISFRGPAGEDVQRETVDVDAEHVLEIY